MPLPFSGINFGATSRLHRLLCEFSAIRGVTIGWLWWACPTHFCPEVDEFLRGWGCSASWPLSTPDLRYILKLRVRHVWPPPQFWAGDAQWRIQKFWKVGAGDSVATSSSFMAGVRTQQTICLLYGKRRQKIQSQWEYPSPLNRPLATPLSAFVGRLIFSGAWRQAILSWAGPSMNRRLRALWYEWPVLAKLPYLSSLFSV